MKILTVLLITVVTICGNAQITITHDNFVSTFAIGNTFAMDTAQNGVSINLGTASSTVQTFDFSAL